MIQEGASVLILPSEKCLEILNQKEFYTTTEERVRIAEEIGNKKGLVDSKIGNTGFLFKPENANFFYELPNEVVSEIIPNENKTDTTLKKLMNIDDKIKEIQSFINKKGYKNQGVLTEKFHPLTTFGVSSFEEITLNHVMFLLGRFMIFNTRAFIVEGITFENSIITINGANIEDMYTIELRVKDEAFDVHARFNSTPIKNVEIDVIMGGLF